MDHYEDEHADEIQFEEEEIEGTTQRGRGRGSSIPNWKTQPCSFDASGKCISENSSAFSKHVASEVRDYKNIPLVRDWRMIKEDRREAFWNRIKETIIFQEEDMAKMPMIRYTTLHIAEHAHKEYRNKFKKKHYIDKPVEEHWNTPPNVDPRQWADLVSYWNKEKTKEITANNKHNRRLKTMNHTTGAKSFARVKAELRKKHGKEIPASFFRHCRTQKDSTGATMEGNIQNTIESGQEDSDELRTRVYVETMGPINSGPERHNRLRGYGHGVTPDMVSYASSSASSSNSSRRSFKSSVAVLITENNELRRKNEADTKRMADLEVKLEKQQTQNQLLTLVLQKLQPPPPYSSGTQQSGHSQPPPPPYPYLQGTQQSAQNQQPPGAPVYSYTGYNQQPPSYPVYPTQPTAYIQQPPMAYMQQPPMSYMQQPPYQMHVYRPEMPSSDGIYLDVPIGVFSGMLAGAPLDVDMSRDFRLQGRSVERGSVEGSRSHSGSGSTE